MEHFKVTLKDGFTYCMGGKCNKIDYSNPIYLQCLHIGRDTWGRETKQVLYMFPHSAVMRIENVLD